MESINLKEQYEKIIEKYSELLMRIKTACPQASAFVPQEFLNPVKEKLHKSMQKDYVTRLGTLKRLIESNSAEESKRQEIKIQENLLQTLEETTVSSYEKILKNFFEQLEEPSRKTRKDKIKEFVEIVQSKGFIQILTIIGNVYRFLYSYKTKNDSLFKLQKSIREVRKHFELFVNSSLETLKTIREDMNFPKDLTFWETKIKSILQKAREIAPDMYALAKDSETDVLTFNAQTENTRLQEYNEFLNKSLTYTKKESGLIAVNLHQFFLNNYDSPHWLWIAELLNCLFDTQETEVSIRENLKKQLQQTIVFLPRTGLYYLKKKDKVKPS